MARWHLDPRRLRRPIAARFRGVRWIETLELGRRLAAAFPLAQLDEVADATTFVSIDRPDAVISAVEGVLATSRT